MNKDLKNQFSPQEVYYPTKVAKIKLINIT